MQALGWSVGVGVVSALSGGLMLLLAGPTTLGQGTGVVLLLASPILAISTGVVVAMSHRRVRHRAGGARPAASGLSGAPPMPPIGYVRVGYYKLKVGTADGVARRLQDEAALLYGREAGFVGCQVVRAGPDELISISQWLTREQAEAAVDREIRWMKATVAATVLQTESHVGAVVGAQ